MQAESRFAVGSYAGRWPAHEEDKTVKAHPSTIVPQTIHAASARYRPRSPGLSSALVSYLRTHPRLLRWALPFAVLFLILVYELIAAGWVHNRIGFSYHAIAEILFLATLGPIAAAFFARLFERWLDERDTSDWQAQLLDTAHANSRLSRQLNDEALQAIFSASLVIEALTALNPDLPPELRDQADGATRALGDVNRRLHAYLVQADG
jgi:hypothetical protein